MAPNEGLSAWLGLLHTRQAVLGAIEDVLLAEHGMTGAWFEVLSVLGASPEGRLGMQDLATAIALSKSGATRVVDRMAAEGLVERVGCEHDRRVTYASVTAAGREAFHRALPAYERGVEERFSRHLTRAERKLLRDALRKVLAANGRDEPVCPSEAAGVQAV